MLSKMNCNLPNGSHNAAASTVSPASAFSQDRLSPRCYTTNLSTEKAPSCINTVAHTCFRALDIPKESTSTGTAEDKEQFYQDLKQILLKQQDSGFTTA